VTDYSPTSCPLFADLVNHMYVQAIVLDKQEKKWISYNGELIYFDDGDTPTDTSDDQWTFLGLPKLRDMMSTLVPNSDGTLWIKTHSSSMHSTPGCSGTEQLYYFDMGEPENALDDQWMQYPIEDYFSPCFFVFGPDAKGNLWLKDNPPVSYDGAWYLFDDGAVPTELSDDTWRAWTVSDAPFFSINDAAVDPVDGLWIGGYLFNYGDSIEDNTDDEWWQIEYDSPKTMAVDSTGGRWFGYWHDYPAIRYLNDNGTREVSEDDTWLFYTEGGEPHFSKINDIQIDGLDEKWIIGYQQSDPGNKKLCTLNDNGSPLDESDDTWTCYTTDDGLFGTDVNAIAIGSDSGIWIGTNWGVSYLYVDR
jgi:hypothetical protein